MKQSEFYTTTGTYASGDSGAIDFAQLNSVPVADLISRKLSDPYVMGYIAPDKVPNFQKIGHPVNDGKNFHVDYIEENHGWGYTALNGRGWAAHAIKKNSTLLSGFSNNVMRMMNSGFMSCANYPVYDGYLIGLRITLIAEPNEYANDNIIYDEVDNNVKFQNVSINPTFAYSSIIDFVENNAKLSFTANVFGGRTFEFSISDANEYGTYTAKDTLNEITAFFKILSFFGDTTSINEVAYARSDSNITNTIYLVPFIQSSFIEDPNSQLDSSIKITTAMTTTFTHGGLRLRFDNATELFVVTWNNFREFDRYFIGWIPYNVNVNEIYEAYDGIETPFYRQGKSGVVAGKFIFNSLDGNGSFDIQPCILVQDIYNNFILMHKRLTAYSGDYTELRSYNGIADVSLFDENNVPLYKTEQGLATDPTFIGKLQEWQLPDMQIYKNTFDADDIPEYTPPEPEDEDPFGGVNWLTNSFPYGGTDGFVSQYVLTESQLQSFGANLWAKFFTRDFWESICVILPESLSINASDILNYVVSLREYPFDVSAVGNCVSDSPSIYIGRGLIGIGVSGSSIQRMLEYVGHISITSNVIEPHFNDFRDYEPCTRISVYVPFCGLVELIPSQVVGGTVTLRYSIDFSTGAIQCAVQINRGAFTTNVNTLSGTVGANVQMSASNLTQVLSKGAGALASFSKSAAMFAIGMGEVGMGEAAIANAETQAETAEAVGKFQQGVMKTTSAFSVPDLSGVPAPFFGQSGGFSSFLVTTPMIQRTYHYYELPSNYAHVYGYACNKTVTLSSLQEKGFTVCKNVDLSGIPATQDELIAIESLLTSGVYF